MPGPEILPALRERFSPLVFDRRHTLSDADVDALIEAARWAPSAGNSQPWAFHLRRREDPGHDQLVARLAASSRRWAPDASALVVNLAHREVEDSGIEYSEFADYDLGQAVAHMTVQAHAMGLACRQFRAFDLAAVERTINVAPGWKVVTMTAIGIGAPDPGAERTRRTIGELRSDGTASTT